jgi:pantothenate kinase-related protein Tda10
MGGLRLTCIKDLASWNMTERGLSHYFDLFQDVNSLLTFKRTEYFEAHDHVATQEEGMRGWLEPHTSEAFGVVS